MRITFRNIFYAICAVSFFALSQQEFAADGYRVFGRVLNGTTGSPITNVNVGFFFDPLSSAVDADPILLSTNTDAAGNFAFDNLPGELSGDVRLTELPAGYVIPMKETIRLSTLTPTNEVIFRAGSAAALSGTIVITNGTTDRTKFRVEVNATEVDVAANGTFLIPELPAYQQTMRLIYQDGFYFDERVVPLPSLTAGITNTMQISWHKPQNSLTTSGVLRDAQSNLLASALIQFLGKNTGVFVGMKTDANGDYAIYDLPDDCYTVWAFVGRWGIEQRTLSTTDRILCVGNGGSDSDGDGMPNGWETQYGLNPHNPGDAALDADSDGVSNLDEYRRGTDPTDPLSKNLTLYANSAIGNNSYDGLSPTVTGSHGPKLNIQAAIFVAVSGDSVEIAGGSYAETTFDPQTKSLTLKPQGSVTIP
jgi:hypothetical protein